MKVAGRGSSGVPARSRVRPTLCALLVVPLLAGCGGGSAGGGSSPAAVSRSAPSSSSGIVATRWWSTSKAASGSVIDPAHPTAVAAELAPSQPEYCAMLSATVAAGKSVLSGAQAGDPALLAATKAFVAEAGAVAPTPLTGDWKILGGALVALVASGGTGQVKGVDPKAVAAAVQTIGTDAKARCHVDLSAK